MYKGIFGGVCHHNSVEERPYRLKDYDLLPCVNPGD